jgi:hypothetical protein
MVAAALNGSGIPGVTVNTIPPNPILSGIPTNIILVVGIASWGPVNSAAVVGSTQQLVSVFGNPLPQQYDMGTQVYTAALQGATNFRCVRVTDGTDTSAIGDVLDSTSAVGAVLSARYTGTVGNTLNAVISIGTNSTPSLPTYKLNIFLTNGIAETFDNIGGTGATFWSNLVNAVNMGQNALRGPSQLVKAGISGTITSVAVNAAGSYTTLPVASATIGTGATFALTMKALTAAPVAAGTGYAVNDTITLTGGTSSATAVLTVASIGASGAITGLTVGTAGAYTALPTNPVSQASSSGSGTGGTFTLAWGLLSVAVTAPGTGYTSDSEFVLTGGGSTGGGVGTLTLSSGSTAIPAVGAYTFAGGTNGNAGVTDTTLIGSDTANPRTGMYAGRNSGANMGIVADQTDPTFWAQQEAYGLSEYTYMQVTVAPGFEDMIAAAVAQRVGAGVASYEAKVLNGDWIVIFDPFNQVTRAVSPQGFLAGILAVTPPSGSSLNKPLNGVIATQKSLEQRTYSDADLLAIQDGGLDVVTLGIPVNPNAFGVRIGQNSSGSITTNGDNYPRMLNFLAPSLQQQMGFAIGEPITPDLARTVQNVMQQFLGNLASTSNIFGAPQIGTLDGSQPYSVVMDLSQASQGFLIANVTVTLFAITLYLIVNLQLGQTVTVTQSQPPQLVA